MAFINEIVSDSDIDKYGLPFAKGSGRYWTRDKERDMYLWGGKRGNPAFGEDIEGVFELYTNGATMEIHLVPGKGSQSYAETPYLIEWKSVGKIKPKDLGGIDLPEVITTLKEALTAYGDDGRSNKYAPAFRVIFNF